MKYKPKTRSMVTLIINKIVLVLTKYHGSAETDSDTVNEKKCLFFVCFFFFNLNKQKI